MRTIALAILCGLWAVCAPSVSAEETARHPGFDRLKSLEGTWTGRSGWDEGADKGAGEVTVIYKVTAAGSAVQETLFPGTPHEMVTMYHMDGADLMLTHYCAAGNQPRMKLEPSADPGGLSPYGSIT